MEGSTYRFWYDSDARVLPDFQAFVAFPDVGRTYESDHLFPFFANRLMSPRRPDFDDYVESLGLSLEEWTPLELLARSAGERATDTIQVVAEPTTEGAAETIVFPASGVRYVEGAAERIGQLQRGQSLHIREEPDNPHDPRALLLDVTHQAPVGWVPAYLLDYVHKRREDGANIRVTVERANGREAPWHLRLICRLVAIHPKSP